jgi:hypothetical protein
MKTEDWRMKNEDWRKKKWSRSNKPEEEVSQLKVTRLSKVKEDRKSRVSQLSQPAHQERSWDARSTPGSGRPTSRQPSRPPHLLVQTEADEKKGRPNGDLMEKIMQRSEPSLRWPDDQDVCEWWPKDNCNEEEETIGTNTHFHKCDTNNQTL